jgi:hypothetical protein
LVCPVCEKDDSRSKDWCPSCGAYLGLLTRQPRHIGTCIRASILVGIGLFLGLAWQIFMPLAEGWPVGQPTRWFWLGFALATFFLALGLTARQHLVSFLHRRPRAEAAPGASALTPVPSDAPGSPDPR